MGPGQNSISFFGQFGKEDAILCLVSGGSSSLLCLPRPGITLSRKRAAVQKLMASGNAVLTEHTIYSDSPPQNTVMKGDVIQATNERWHRATCHPNTGSCTRLAMTPRNKEGQVHYFQTDQPPGN